MPNRTYSQDIPKDPDMQSQREGHIQQGDCFKHAVGLDGEKIDFNTFRGRAVLIENVASL